MVEKAGSKLSFLFFNTNKIKEKRGNPITGRYTTIRTVLEIINKNGLEGIVDAVTILINEAIKVERPSAIKAKPFFGSKGRTD